MAKGFRLTHRVPHAPPSARREEDSGGCRRAPWWGARSSRGGSTQVDRGKSGLTPVRYRELGWGRSTPTLKPPTSDRKVALQMLSIIESSIARGTFELPKPKSAATLGAVLDRLREEIRRARRRGRALLTKTVIATTSTGSAAPSTSRPAAELAVGDAAAMARHREFAWRSIRRRAALPARDSPRGGPRGRSRSRHSRRPDLSRAPEAAAPRKPPQRRSGPRTSFRSRDAAASRALVPAEWWRSRARLTPPAERRARPPGGSDVRGGIPLTPA